MLHDWRTKAQQIAKLEEKRASNIKNSLQNVFLLNKLLSICSVCKKESEAEIVQMFDHGCDLYEHSWVNHYAINPPRGFSQCRFCNNWICKTCQEQGICKNCVESAFENA
jgi:hypothetical protein